MKALLIGGKMVTYLSSRVDNLRSKLLTLVLDSLTEGILDSRIVAIDKVSVDELDSKRGLAWEESTMS